MGVGGIYGCSCNEEYFFIFLFYNNKQHINSYKLMKYMC